MNALDLYEYDGTLGSRTPQERSLTPSNTDDTQSTSTTTASPTTSAQPTLNDEVTQVIGQLGRFWGGFRKQVGIMLFYYMPGPDDFMDSRAQPLSKAHGKRLVK